MTTIEMSVSFVCLLCTDMYNNSISCTVFNLFACIKIIIWHMAALCTGFFRYRWDSFYHNNFYRKNFDFQPLKALWPSSFLMSQRHCIWQILYQNSASFVAYILHSHLQVEIIRQYREFRNEAVVVPLASNGLLTPVSSHIGACMGRNPRRFQTPLTISVFGIALAVEYNFN